MGGLCLLCLLFVCAMALYVKKVRRDYHKAIIYLAEGGDMEDEEDACMGDVLEDDIAAHKAYSESVRRDSMDKRANPGKSPKRKALKEMFGGGPNGPLTKLMGGGK